MSSTSSTTVGGVVVITHVHPIAGAQGAQGAQNQLSVGVQKFSQGRTVALGTVQIIIGVMVLLFGIAMAFNADTLGIYSGIFVWGAAFYITAGSLTVAAVKTLNRCKVNTAMGFNIVAAITSCTATILYSLDAAGVMNMCNSFYPGSWPTADCSLYLTRSLGVSGVLAVFHLLELFVSISVAAFACNATCQCNTEMVSYPKSPEELRASGVPEPPSYNIVCPQPALNA